MDFMKLEKVGPTLVEYACKIRQKKKNYIVNAPWQNLFDMAFCVWIKALTSNGFNTALALNNNN